MVLHIASLPIPTIRWEGIKMEISRPLKLLTRPGYMLLLRFKLLLLPLGISSVVSVEAQPQFLVPHQALPAKDHLMLLLPLVYSSRVTPHTSNTLPNQFLRD